MHGTKTSAAQKDRAKRERFMSEIPKTDLREGLAILLRMLAWLAAFTEAMHIAGRCGEVQLSIRRGHTVPNGQ